MSTQDYLPQPASNDNPLPQTAPAPSSWEAKYRTERTRSRILGVTTVAASLVAVGLGAWGLTQQGSTTNGPGQFGPQAATGQIGPPGASGQMPGAPGTGGLPGGPSAASLADQLLNSDGSVNAAAVQQFVAQAPSEAIAQILARAVADGELTQAQADEIADLAKGAGSATDQTSVQDT